MSWLRSEYLLVLAGGRGRGWCRWCTPPRTCRWQPASTPCSPSPPTDTPPSAATPSSAGTGGGGLLFQIFTSTFPQVLPTQKVWIRLPQHPHHSVCVLVCQRHQISGVPLPEDRAADHSAAHRPQALCGLQHLHEPPQHPAQHLRAPGVSPLHELQDLPCRQTTQ